MSDVKNEESTALAAVQGNGYALRFQSDDMKNNESIVLAAVQDYGCALEFASEDMKSKESIVLAAVQRSGYALEFASEELRADPEVVMTAVKQCGMAIKHCLGDARESREIAIGAVNCDEVMCLDAVPERFQNDREVVLIAVAKKGIALQHASEPLRADREIVLTACRACEFGESSAFEYASLELRSDRDFVQDAMKQLDPRLSKELLKHASPELQKELVPPPLSWLETGRSAIEQVGQVAEGLVYATVLVGTAAVEHIQSASAPAQDDTQTESPTEQAVGGAEVEAKAATTPTPEKTD